MNADRILKLIRLAQNNPSPEEAAVAFAQAQRLATRAGLQIDDLLVAAEEHEAPQAPRVVGEVLQQWIDHWDRAVPWKLAIARAVLRANLCKHAISTGSGGGILGYGTEEHLATARYVYQAIVREVDALAQAAVAERGRLAAWDRGEAVTYGRSWRLGCAHAIDQRMPDPEAEIEAARAEVDEARRLALTGESTPNMGALAIATNALARVEQAEDYRARVHERVTAHFDGLNLRSGRGYQGARDLSGYAAGRRAGATVGLGGGRARALKGGAA